MKDLLRLLNLGNRCQQLLPLTWLTAALRPRGPYPILAIKGTQGSAKSTCQRILRALVDPSESPLRTAPRDERDMMIAAKHSHLIGADNISHISDSLSDSFCRLSTGGGLGTRVLYTDDRQILFNGSRPIFVNGISDLAERGDLLDRIIYLNLPPIPDDKRRPEEEIWREFEAAKPKIFGALLDVMAQGLRRFDSVRLAKLPRMADFAKWGVAVEQPLGYQPGEFLECYERNRRESSLIALEFAPAASFIPALLNSSGGAWEGTHRDLLSSLNLIAPHDRRDSEWPKSAKKMAIVLSRSEPNLLTAGAKVIRLKREGGTGARRIRLELLGTGTVTRQPTNGKGDSFAGDDVTNAEEKVPPVQ